MKMKYYMRGLGVGIVLATIILTISNNVCTADLKAQVVQLSQDATKESLEDIVKGTQKETGNINVLPLDTETGSETSSQTQTAQTQTAQQTAPSQTSEEPTKPVETKPLTEPDSAPYSSYAVISTASVPTRPTVSQTKEISISFQNVSSSESAAQLLAEAGLIEDWRDFNTFLIDNGYDRKISNGTFIFSGGESYEELAQIITNRG